jgi:hypothetical protein
MNTKRNHIKNTPNGAPSTTPTSTPKTKARVAPAEQPYLSQALCHRIRSDVPPIWDQAKDEEHFYVSLIKNCPPDKDHHEFLFERIEAEMGRLHVTLDSIADELLTDPVEYSAFGQLSVAGKAKVIRSLLVDQVPHVPRNHQRNFLFNLDDHLTQCEDVDQHSQTVLRNLALKRTAPWLAELVDLADAVATVWIELDEALGSERPFMMLG